MKSLISSLANSKIFTAIDIRFAEFICKLDGRDDRDIFLSAALVSNITAGGDTCLDIARYAERVLTTNAERQELITPPDFLRWREKLLASPVVGRPGDFRPLVLDDKNRLYLYRYWEYQKNLADAIHQKAAHTVTGVNLTVLKQGLKRLFPSPAPLIDWQQIAAAAAVLNRFSVISGGPGTGKTYLIAKILALLLQQDGGNGLRIFLTAPTGKAAMKLSATLQNALKTISDPDGILAAIPSEASTIHRLLQTIPNSPYFRYHQGRPLPADVVVVDEASMIDLALMSKLFQAIPVDARVILIGDRDQLASVEAGAVLGDICNHDKIHYFSEAFYERIRMVTGVSADAPGIIIQTQTALHDSIITLQKNYRYSEQGGIGGFSRAVKSGNAGEALDLLGKKEPAGIQWQDALSADALEEILNRISSQAYGPYLRTAEPLAALERFSGFQILCVMNKGPFGVAAVNQRMEQILIRKGLIAAAARSQNPWYRGRPVLITRNDYRLGLYNGDIGITLPDHPEGDGSLYVFFPGSRGRSERFRPHQLPEHQTVYAMTVHKSQGSEFAKILLVLPDTDSPVLTRELIYTAVTRAREEVIICGSKHVLRTAISRGISRTSGLRDALWQ